MDERKTSRSRRRASRILAEKRRKGPPLSCDDESPTRERTKPPRRKKKEPIYEEDIVEGFAILSYLRFDDIELSLNGGKVPKKKSTTNSSNNSIINNSNNNGNNNNDNDNNSPDGVVVSEQPKVPEVIIKEEVPPAPPPAIKVNHIDKVHQDPGTSDDSCREKEKIKVEREIAVIKRDPESEDNRVSDASSRCSSGRGYLCDSEDDDKNSDSGSVLFSASPPVARKLDVPSEVVNGHGTPPERITVKTNGSPRPPTPTPPPPPLQLQPSALQLPPQPQAPPPKPSPNHYSPVSIPNGVTKMERVSPSPTSIPSAHPQHHRVLPPPVQAGAHAAVTYSRPGYPPAGYALPPAPHPHPHTHSHPQPSPTACAPTPPSLPSAASVAAYHPPLYAPYNSTPYLPPTSLHQPPSRSPIGLKPITTSSVGLVVTTTTTTTSHRDTINAPLIGRTHSPRGHSPSRERDSYSSNVSSLSRGSIGTPSSMPSYSSPHHPSVVPSVPPVVAPTAQPSSLPYKQPSPWVSSSNPPQPTAPGRTGLNPHHHPFASPMFPPNSVPAPPVSTAPAPPPAPNPFSAESLFQSSKSNQGDLLRRELDSRFLATQDRSPYIRTEMHHHQHQHTHVHQHTPIIPPPTLFSTPIVNFNKDMPKGTPVDSPFYRQSLGFTGYPGYTPGLIHPSFGSATPFAPPSHLPTFTPKQLTEPSKPKTVKTGKWNAMHVRVAWEIYHHQQKSGGGEGKVGPLLSKSDFMRPPTHMFGPPPQPHHFTPPAHRTVPPAYDPTPPSFPPTMGSSVFGRYPPAASSFPTGLPTFPHAPAIHDPWGRIQPRGMPSQGFPPPHPWGLKPEVIGPDEREREKERERSRERERQRREEKQRQRLVGVTSKVRERSPLREPSAQMHPATATSKEEEVAMLSRSQHYLAAAAARQAPRPLPPHFPQSPWDTYRYDPLRYNPLMAVLQEEEQRAKLFGAYPGGPPPSLAHLRPKAPSPSHRLPPAPHPAVGLPKEDPNHPSR